MKEIQLTQGYVAIVDDEDFEELSKFKWKADVRTRGVYAKRYVEKNVNYVRDRRCIYMHRQIMGIEDYATCVDHRNGNSLDNRRENMRLCTRAENCRNKKHPENSPFQFKGVFRRPSGNWGAKITFQYKGQNLGTFSSPIEAARAYDQKAKELHGEFACLNFP